MAVRGSWGREGQGRSALGAARCEGRLRGGAEGGFPWRRRLTEPGGLGGAASDGSFLLSPFYFQGRDAGGQSRAASTQPGQGAGCGCEQTLLGVAERRVQQVRHGRGRSVSTGGLTHPPHAV